MRRAAVCVGVDVVAGLGTLEQAASGARAFAAWAEKQGYDVTCLTHPLVRDGSSGTPSGQSSVTHRAVTEAVEEYAEAGVYEQLIVYFAGHGMLKDPSAEFWLLSDARRYNTEAVNVIASISWARLWGIPHV